MDIYNDEVSKLIADVKGLISQLESSSSSIRKEIDKKFAALDVNLKDMDMEIRMNLTGDKKKAASEDLGRQKKTVNELREQYKNKLKELERGGLMGTSDAAVEQKVADTNERYV